MFPYILFFFVGLMSPRSGNKSRVSAVCGSTNRHHLEAVFKTGGGVGPVAFSPPRVELFIFLAGLFFYLHCQRTNTIVSVAFAPHIRAQLADLITVRALSRTSPAENYSFI